MTNQENDFLLQDALLQAAARFIRLWCKTHDNASLADEIAAKMDAAVNNSRAIEWIGTWVPLADRYPPIGESLVVLGTLPRTAGAHTGFGRYGMKGGNVPGIGYLGDSYDWFCSPTGLQVHAWMRFPKVPIGLFSDLSK